MQVIEKKIPLHVLGIKKGDTLVGWHITPEDFVVQFDTPRVGDQQKKSVLLQKWIKESRGIIELAPGETRQGMRDEYLRQKYG